MVVSRSTASDLAPAAEPRRRGRLEHAGSVLELEASAASHLSLRVEMLGDERVADGAVFSSVEIDVERGPLRLGRCRFSAEAGAARASRGTPFLRIASLSESSQVASTAG